MLRAKFTTNDELEARRQAAEEARQAKRDRDALLDDMVAEQASKRAKDSSAPDEIRAAAQREEARRNK